MTKILHTDDHDTVAQKFASLIAKNNPDEYAITIYRPSNEAELKPDITLENPKTGELEMAIEVETNQTLTEETAQSRWVTSSNIAPKLQIVIPKGTLNRARRYAKKLGIKTSFYEY